MNKKLFLHLLDIAYPVNELPLDGDKIAHLFRRFDNYVRGFTLSDDGKILVNETIICDLSKGEEYLQLALAEIRKLESEIIIKTGDPKQRYLLTVIREMTKRGRVLNRVEALQNETLLYFS